VCLELRHVLEMVQLETRELEGVKLQHNQKLDQLEKSQDTLLEVSPKKKMSSLPVLFVLLFDMSLKLPLLRCVWNCSMCSKSCRSSVGGCTPSNRRATTCNSKQTKRGAACRNSAETWRPDAHMLWGNKLENFESYWKYSCVDIW